jgi:signal peptidase II
MTLPTGYKITAISITLNSLTHLSLRNTLHINQAKSMIINILNLCLLDQATKWLAYQSLLPPLPLLQWILTFNKGFSFNIGAELHLILLIFLQTSIWLYVWRSFVATPIRTLVTAGFLSNLLDRFTYGGVLDFIYLKTPLLHLPFIFNLADVYIFIASILIIFDYYAKTRQKAGNTV